MFDNYVNRVTARGETVGQIRKYESDQVMNDSWWDDIQSRVCYIYDYQHDNEPTINYNRHPQEDPQRTPIDAKFIITQYQTLAKDQVEFHLQFRPGQKDPTDYYQQTFGKIGAKWPIGYFCDVPDDEGIYNRWLICQGEIANAFVKYSVLPCNYYFHWIYNAKKYDLCGVLRLRNSYNQMWFAAIGNDAVYSFLYAGTPLGYNPGNQQGRESLSRPQRLELECS